MSEEKKIFQAKSPILIDDSFDHSDAGFSSGHEVIDMVPIMEEEKSVPVRPMHPRPSLPSRVGIVGNYLPRRCGIATFTTDLCDALHAEYGAVELLALPVNGRGIQVSIACPVRWRAAAFAVFWSGSTPKVILNKFTTGACGKVSF